LGEIREREREKGVEDWGLGAQPVKEASSRGISTLVTMFGVKKKERAQKETKEIEKRGRKRKRKEREKAKLSRLPNR
jgi:hypothetical protein